MMLLCHATKDQIVRYLNRFWALSRNVKEWVKLCGIDRERVYKDSGLAGVSGLPA